jgi:signal transduction histidine kinase
MQFLQLARNSKKYSDEINHELDRELIEKTQAVAPGFFMVAAWVMYSHLGSVDNKILVQLIGALLLLTSSWRYLVIRFYFLNKLNFLKSIYYTKINIIINGILWALVLLIPLHEFQPTNSISNITFLTIIVGFTISSVVTLSFDLFYAYFFQWILAIPSTIYLFYLANVYSNDFAFDAAVVGTIGIIYLFNQTRNIHNQTVKRISVEVDLKKANKLLKVSQKDLIDEKAKLQHSIRLAAVGEISGEIAHEINNPLGLIVGYLELSLEELKSENPNRAILEIKLLKARSAISRITKIIRGLRHYSKNTVDEPMLPSCVNEIIEDAVDFCSEKFSYHKVNLKIHNPNDFTIQCRAIEISQVLLNIFTNAIDEVSRLDSENRLIEIQTEALGEGWLKILISNTGSKVDPSIQARLFEPFFSTKKMGIGTGLGLSISRNIVENHGGRLYYNPNLPLTTFIIELPLDSAAVTV